MATILKRWVRQRRLRVALTLLVIGMVPSGMALGQEAPSAESVATAVNYVWVMTAAILVFFMRRASPCSRPDPPGPVTPGRCS
jgi:hypothetical protein